MAACLLLGAVAPAEADARLYNQLGRGSMPEAPSINDPAFQAEVLRAHNVERRVVGVRDLVWWEPLARDAQAWANHIAARNVMEHAPQRRHGENIWYNRAGMRTVGAMIGNWSIEKRWYIVGARQPNISTTGRWRDVGHYTQMVWSKTTHVGCAIARANGRDFLVCRYAPLGNYRGEMAFDPKGIVRTAAPADTKAGAPAMAARTRETTRTAGASPAGRRAEAAPAGTAPAVAVTAEPAAPEPRGAPIPVIIPRVSREAPVPQPAAKPSVIVSLPVHPPAVARR